MSSLENLAFEKHKFGAIQALLSFVAYVLLSIFSSLLISTYASQLIFSHPEFNTVNFRLAGTLSASIVSTAMSLMLIWSLLKKYFDNPITAIALTKSSLNWNLLGVFIGVVVSQFVNHVVYDDISSEEVERLSPFKGIETANILIKLTYLFVVALMAPFFEEFLFRGVLYRGFARSLGKLAAMIVVTLLFVLSHTLILRLESLSLLATLITVSIILMALRHASQSLIPSIVLHQTYNAALVFT